MAKTMASAKGAPSARVNQKEIQMKDEAQFSMDNDNPLFRKVTLRRPEDFAPGERPAVSLHLMVKNGESCIGRLLENVGPYINEIVAVANDCTDRTISILKEYAEFRGSGFNLYIIEVTPENHPELYMMDSPETYALGKPLVGEAFEVPFTNKPLLSDWAAARNLGWVRCTKPWILFLDADDLVLDPESIPGLCVAMDTVGADLAATRYIYSVGQDGKSRADSFRERLCRNVPYISWCGATHEVLRGQIKTAQIDGNLVVRDMKDSAGEGVRVPGRCLKVLYHDARVNDWMVSPRTLIYLAMEARPTMPDFASAVLKLYLTMSLWPEERAWACCMRGEIHESRGEYPLASEWYEKALAEHPGSKAAFRLCRSRFHEQKWQEAVDAYQVGIENKAVLQIIDNGEGFEAMSKILVTAALDKLDRRDEALAMCEEALKAYPREQALITMHEQFKARI
jgi:glycosyltransferase involved in cell wall biosynthesis